MIPDEQDFRARVSQWMRGNREATDLIVHLHHVVETWDDLIDRDTEIELANINRAFYAALIEIPRNRFYQDHFSLLSPVIEGAILDWYAANAFEKEKKYELAWALANAGLSVTVMCARIIGGPEWAKNVSLEFRSITKTLQEFVAEKSNGVDQGRR